jgi:hypothetical protein
MKKMLFLITLLGLILSSCSKNIIASSQPRQPQPQADTAIAYKQSLYNSTNLKNILFYNSKEIKLQKSFLKQVVVIENGAVIQTDSLNNVSKVIEKMTPGSILNIDSTKVGDINMVDVSFSKEDYSYNIVFQKTRDGSFVTYSKGKIIFKNKKFPTDLIINGECKLMFYFKKNEVINEINEIANGVKLDE